MTRAAVLLLILVAARASGGDWRHTTVAGAGGVPLNVVTVGDPAHPAILFVHGIGQSHYSFHRQLDSSLADEFLLVAFDLRGHGGSGKPWSAEAYRAEAWAGDVAAVMRATGIRRPVLVAWSYGTLVAMDFIREAGQAEIAGLMLTGALGALRPFRPPPEDDPLAERFAQLRQLALSPDLVDNVRASEQMVDLLAAGPIPEADRQLFRAISLMLPVHARRAMLERPLDNQDMADRLSLPTLMALGERDSSAMLEHASALAADKENFQLSVYEGAGHSVFFEQPQRFNEELRAFARRAIGQAGTTDGS